MQERLANLEKYIKKFDMVADSLHLEIKEDI